MHRDEVVADPSFGKSVSHSHVRTSRRWNPNIQRVRAIVKGAPKATERSHLCLKAGKGRAPSVSVVPASC